MQAAKTIFQLFRSRYKAMTISNANSFWLTYSVDEEVIRKCLTSRYLLDPREMQTRLL